MRVVWVWCVCSRNVTWNVHKTFAGMNVDVNCTCLRCSVLCKNKSNAFLWAVFGRKLSSIHTSNGYYIFEHKQCLITVGTFCRHALQQNIVKMEIWLTMCSFTVPQWKGDESDHRLRNVGHRKLDCSQRPLGILNLGTLFGDREGTFRGKKPWNWRHNAPCDPAYTLGTRSVHTSTLRSLEGNQ